jgi:nucleotide-binding universal stress UspA family protein
MSEAETTRQHTFERIIHPTDFTAGSYRAFAHGLRLALAAGGHFHIVHAERTRDEEEASWEGFPGVRRTLAAWGVLSAETPAHALADTLGVRIRKIGLEGRDPVQGVLRLLDQRPADLIVLATHARSGLPRWLRGSVAEPLARKAQVPALFVPHDCRGFVDQQTGEVRLRNVLIPVDRAPDAQSAVALGLRVADLLEADAARFHLLHAGTADDAPALEVDPRHAPRLLHLNRPGPVVEAILDAAEAVDADLLVMATRGHDGILDVFRGSTTEQVLRRAGRAVLAVPTL